MTNAVKFADKYSSHNLGLVVADHGTELELKVWVNPTQRWHSVTRRISKRFIGKRVVLSPHQEAAL